MSEKYYSISPYGYCGNNPIKHVDPTGMFYGDYYSGYSGKFLFSDGIVRIHSHPNEVGGTKGGSPGDIKNAKGKGNVFFGVYFKGNQTLYEYNSKKSNTNETKINSLDDFMKLINDRNK